MGSWGGNLRPGGTAVQVVEADEYDRSFLALTPAVAVVTNVEADHLDIYSNLADIRSAFPGICTITRWAGFSSRTSSAISRLASSESVAAITALAVSARACRSTSATVAS